MRNREKIFLLLLLVSVCFIVAFLLSDGRQNQFIPTHSTYNVWIIFTKATSKSDGIALKFRHMLVSLLRESSVKITVNAIVDETSGQLAKDIVHEAVEITHKHAVVELFNISSVTSSGRAETIESLKRHFSPAGYYSDPLFYSSLFLDTLAPLEQTKVIMLDVDLQFQDDIAHLFAEFEQFGSEALIGASPELSPVYYHLLHAFRAAYPESDVGTPCCAIFPPPESGLAVPRHDKMKGKPGINSGVLLLNLERIRESKRFDNIRSPQYIVNLTSKYMFKGHLGDQDVYSLISFEAPELIHSLSCGWNRQLCTWWKDRGYLHLHDVFALCPEVSRLYHANCNSPFPSDT